MSTTTLTNRLIKWLNRETPPRDIPLCDFEKYRHELKACDVILVEGRSRVSSVIRLITNSPWTHAALYIGRLHDIEDPALRDTIIVGVPHETIRPRSKVECHLVSGPPVL